MTLSERICEFVRACFTGIWIESHEHDDATAELAELCRQQSWNLATWTSNKACKSVVRLLIRTPMPIRWPPSGH